MVALSRPNNPSVDPKSHVPLPLLCIPYKILEKLIYARVEPIISQLLPQDQAGFRQKRSAIDQVILLTQEIEDNIRQNRKPVLYLLISQQPTIVASRSYSASTAGQARDLNNSGTLQPPQLHPYHRHWKTNQAATP